MAPAESYPFTVLRGSLAGSRLRFQTLNNEVWQPWCVLQMPIPDQANPGSYSCVETSPLGYSSENLKCYVPPESTHKVDCGKVVLCTHLPLLALVGVCRCDATSCSVQPDSGGIAFDLSISGDRMDGSISSSNDVHLTKN